MDRVIKPSQVIYVGGVEHSGSTLLGLILDNHSDIICVGELSHLARVGWHGTANCSCGLLIKECPFWQEVRDLWENTTNDKVESLIELERTIDHNKRLPQVMINRYIQTPSATNVYKDYSIAMLEAIRKVSGKEIIVDTSKRISRAIALSSIKEIEFQLIHLIRDSRGVAYSSGKPSRAIKRPWWQSAIRWNLINWAFDNSKTLIPSDNVINIRYEDLIQSPQHVLTRIGVFIDSDFSELIDTFRINKPLKPNHIAAGNRFLQNNQEFILNSTVDWPQKMPHRIQNRVWKLTRKRMMLHDYYQNEAN